MTDLTYYVPPETLPESGFGTTLEEARRHYVMQAFCELPIVRQALGTMEDGNWISIQAVNQPNVYGSAREYTTLIAIRANEELGGDSQDIWGFSCREDARRLKEMCSFASSAHTEFNFAEMKTVRKTSPIQLHRGFGLDAVSQALRIRTTRTLHAERQILKRTLKRQRSF